MTSRHAVSKHVSEISIQSLFSGGRYLALLLVLLLLSACGGGGGGGGGTSREVQLYQDAMAAYQIGDYTSAASLFSQGLTEFPNGTYSDESQYRLGRSQQALNNFDAARSAYSLVSTTGSWAVDAAFYSARTYYDAGGLSTVPADAYGLYDTAITQLAAVNSTYPTSGLVDQTNYYLGRTYQDQATLLNRDPALSSTTTTAQRFVDARTRYATVQNTSVFYDNALYFTGRSYHEQAPADYANARSTYQLLIADITSSWSDDAQYQYAKTYYDAAGDALDPNSASYDPVTAGATAMTGFNTAITEFGKVASTSNRADSALYYKGRSLHKQAALVEADPTLSTTAYTQYFADARTAYQSVITLGVASPYEDNAQYRIGRTYYDEAVIALGTPDYASAQQKLSDAIAAMSVVITNTTYQASNSADNAHYYLGRSFQRGAEIPAGNEIAVAGGVDFTAVTFASARSHFDVLTASGSAFATSAWVDNAFYETGNTWRGQVLDGSSTDPLADYTAALASYNTVLSTYKGASSREDNAARKVATVYHETGYCTDEQAAYTYVKTIAAATAFSIAEADTHLNDLLNKPTATHPCVQTIANLPGFTAP